MVLGNNKETQIELDEIDKRMEEYTASVVMEHDTAWNGFSDFIKDQKKVRSNFWFHVKMFGLTGNKIPRIAKCL